LPRVLHERERVRRVAGKLLARVYGFDGYLALHRVPPELFPSLDIPEKRDLFEGKEIGGVPTFLERAREAGLGVVTTDWRRPEEQRVQQLEAHPEADLAFLYLSGLDAILHRDGGLDAGARDWSKQAARWIHRAQRALRSGGREVRTVVVGDHGMARIEHTVDPRGVLAKVRGRFPKAFVFVDATMFRVSVGPCEPEAVRELFQGIAGELLDAGGLAERGAPSDGRYGDYVWLLPEGSLFVPSFVGGAVRGMHGYDRASRSARAALLSDGVVAAECLEDLAPWVLRELGLL
jgi:hypothetical protein